MIAAAAPPDHALDTLDPETAARLERIEAQRAAIRAANQRTRDLRRTLEIAQDLTNESRALRACQALLRGEPLPEESARLAPAPRTITPRSSDHQVAKLPFPEGRGRGKGERRATTSPISQTPASSLPVTEAPSHTAHKHPHPTPPPPPPAAEAIRTKHESERHPVHPPRPRTPHRHHRRTSARPRTAPPRAINLIAAPAPIPRIRAPAHHTRSRDAPRR